MSREITRDIRDAGFHRVQLPPGNWFAAEQGDGHAKANLAALYQAGRGVHGDLVQAYKWYQLSEKNGRTDWSHHLRELANMMTSDEIAEAERMQRVAAA